jgi:RNA polymerase sigma-70 factor (ECF subfamily)
MRAAPQPRATVDQRLLVERAGKGDHDAFAELARAAVVRLDRAARLILRDPELARDAVQDGLIRAWRDLPGLRDPDRFDAWLHRLTVNACLDLARRRRRRPIEVELSPIHHPTIADVSMTVARRDLVEDVLRSLDTGGRAIVVLHYYLGMSLSEVADTLDIPAGTVKSRLHRALSEMRIAIGEPADEPRREAVAGGQVV